MRFSVVLALALAGLTMTAAAQKPQRTRTKPSHREEKDSRKSHVTAKESSSEKSGGAQELRKLEQSSARLSSARKTEGKARTNQALKPRKESNPPIHFASAGPGKGGGGKGKGGDPYKGRMRHKGSRH